ncbi:MAG: redox-regulated ATPase YchF [bacterium]|nr:redox-regulated ATPase YchF [bacterium]
MKLSIGIVGLPNVGKSTLFNALLKKQVAYAANYPFATIEPNVGIVEVPDERLPVLAKVVNTQKIVPATVEFYDIAGLVKGASEGQGLGNKFLSYIREVAAIAHVVRLFEDGDVIHVANKVDPLDDIKTVETELILSDLETLSKQKSHSVAEIQKDKKLKLVDDVVELLKKKLNEGLPARKAGLTDEEYELVKQLNLITFKPVIYVFNVSEKQLENVQSTVEKIKGILKQVQDDTNHYVYLNAKLENDVLTLPEEEQKEYLQQYHLEETGLNRLIKKAYEVLGLISFLTAGEMEVRAWTIIKGSLAPQAAGTIHTDFESHFIKADVIPYSDFVAAPGWVKGRELGKVTSEGKDYTVQDGDVIEFKVNV